MISVGLAPQLRENASKGFNNSKLVYQDKLKTVLRHLAVRDMAKKAKTTDSGKPGCSIIMLVINLLLCA